MSFLHANKQILHSAEQLQLDMDDRILLDTSKKGTKFDSFWFILTELDFIGWRGATEAELGVNFNYHYKKDHPSIRARHSSRTEYRCHRSGTPDNKSESKDLGGESGKLKEEPSIKCQCKSMFALYKRTMEICGQPVVVYDVQYRFHHKHETTDKTQYGSVRASQEIRAEIIRDLEKNISVIAIADRLKTQGSEKLKTALATGTRPTRDMGITYDYIYNIYYQRFHRQIVKDQDETLSAQIWMQDLAAKGCFVHYEPGKRNVFGFSTPWQMDQLERYGDVIHFDGTHDAYG